MNIEREFALRDTPWGLLPKSMAKIAAKVPAAHLAMFKRIGMGKPVPDTHEAWLSTKALEELGFVEKVDCFASLSVKGIVCAPKSSVPR